MDRLDFYEIKPTGMEQYLSAYGWHFSKAMCMWAVGMMKDKNGNKVQHYTKEQLADLMNKTNDKAEAKGYDDVYLAAMVKADFWGGSITSEGQLVKYLCDVLNDKDGYEGMVFTRFYADTIAKGIPIIWEDMM